MYPEASTRSSWRGRLGPFRRGAVVPTSIEATIDDVPTPSPAAAARCSILVSFLTFAAMSAAAATVGGVAPVARFRSIGVGDGLSNQNVYSIAQDRTGFLWVGAEEGLNRYDGYRFEVFAHDPSDPRSLAEDDVSAVLVDGEDRLWLGTWGGGLNLFDPATETFTAFRKGTDPGALRDDRVQALLADRAGTIWVGTYAGGLARFDAATATFATFPLALEPPHALPSASNRVWAIAEAADGLLWLGIDDGVVSFDPASGHFAFFPPPSTKPTARTVVIDRDGVVWVGLDRGLLTLDPRTGSFSLVAARGPGSELLATAAVNTIVERADGELWIGTYGHGLIRLSADRSLTVHYANDPRDPHSLVHDDVRALYEDRSGILWIGTRGGGLATLDLKPEKFFAVTFDPDRDDWLGYRSIWAVHEDRAGRLWVATWAHGVDRLDPGRTSFVHYRHDPLRSDSLPTDMVDTFAEDGAGTVWLGTWGGGLVRYDRDRDGFTTFRHDPADATTLSNDRVRTIAPDPDGSLWVGTVAGLNRLDLATGTFTRFFHDPDDPASLCDDFVRVAFVDGLGDLWIGTDTAGLCRRRVGATTFEHFPSRPGRSGSLSASRVNAIAEDAAGTVWVGTTRGLNRFDRPSSTFSSFHDGDGLANDHVKALLSDAQGRLWMTTNRGLVRFDPGRGEWRTYRAREVFQPNAFTQGGAARGGGGRLYFGGLDGLTHFLSDQVTDNPQSPPVVLRGIDSRGAPVALARPLHLLAAVVLDHDQRFFSIRFAALDFTDPAANRYAYRLDGFDDDWVDAGTRAEAAYTNVDPGRYRFQVRAANGDGTWNERGASLDIVVLPPVWQTWWFRLVAVATVVGAVASLYVVRVNRIKHQTRLLEVTVAERTTELRALNDTKNEFLGIVVHDLRNPLGLILAWTNITIRHLHSGRFTAERGLRDLGRVVKVAEQMNHLIAELLDIAAIEAGKLKLELQSEDLATILAESEPLYSRIAEDKEIVLAVEPAAVPRVLADRARVFEVLDNLLSNAIKYTPPGGSVRVSCEAVDGAVVTHISDTGPGLTAEDLTVVFRSFKRLSAKPTGGEPSTGLGLAIAKKIVELHGGRIWVDSVPGQGATFSFSLPTAPADDPPAIDPAALPGPDWIA